MSSKASEGLVSFCMVALCVYALASSAPWAGVTVVWIQLVSSAMLLGRACK